MAKNTSRVTVDHEEIQSWAEERGGQPARVKGTGIIRLDFPGFSGEGKLEQIGWDEFFEQFDNSELAFVYQQATARGQKSNFNKLVSRESVNLETGDTKAAPPRRRRKQAEAQKRGGRQRPQAQARRPRQAKRGAGAASEAEGKRQPATRARSTSTRGRAKAGSKGRGAAAAAQGGRKSKGTKSRTPARAAKRRR